MSLVGPRPLLERYLDRYTPEQARRHDVRPGLTGLAQVAGRNATSWEQRLALDVEYVDTRSFLGDLRILARTIVMVLRREGINAEGHETMPEFGWIPPSSGRSSDAGSRPGAARHQGAGSGRGRTAPRLGRSRRRSRRRVLRGRLPPRLEAAPGTRARGPRGADPSPRRPAGAGRREVAGTAACARPALRRGAHPLARRRRDGPPRAGAVEAQAVARLDRAQRLVVSRCRDPARQRGDTAARRPALGGVGGGGGVVVAAVAGEGRGAGARRPGRRAGRPARRAGCRPRLAPLGLRRRRRRDRGQPPRPQGLPHALPSRRRVDGGRAPAAVRVDRAGAAGAPAAGRAGRLRPRRPVRDARPP